MLFSLRPATAGDDPFLYELYCSTRHEELAAWGWEAAQQDAFLQFQFRAQQQHYQAQYPQATHQIICCADGPMGHVILADLGDEIRLVDVALLPVYRNSGISTALLGDILTTAA